jgi:small redox-active disulfide protein 2
MKSVKVLGSGCARCVQTAGLIETEAAKLGVAISLEKITDYAAIAAFGIAATPGVVIDGKVVHAGGLPKADDVRAWLKA